MDYKKLFDEIELQAEAIETFWTIHKCCGETCFVEKLAKSSAEYEKGDAAFGAYLKVFAEAEKLPPEMLNMYIYIRMSERTLECYRTRGIDESIFYATMHDLTVCCQVCFDKNGSYGISQDYYRVWMRYVLDGTLYRLGRLQFQLITSEFDIDINGEILPQGSRLLATHIPRGLPLSENACEDSYAQAREFFRKYYGMQKSVFCCESWLLHPWMQECLPQDSAIIRFQNKYRLLRVSNDIPAAVHWIFPGYEDQDVSAYPADTTLRRAAIDCITRGKPMGTALGVRLPPGFEE